MRRPWVDADSEALTAALEESLLQIRERHGGGRQRRVDRCLDTLMGKRKTYHSQPTWMYFPELPAIEFFDRAEFPWLEALEAASTDIRSELLRVLVADREGLQPYIDFPAGLPIDQFRELNRSPPLERVFPLEPERSRRGSHRTLPRDRAGAGSRAALPGCRPGTHCVFLHTRREHTHPSAHRRHQYTLHRALAADRAARLRLPRRGDHPRMGSR